MTKKGIIAAIGAMTFLLAMVTPAAGAQASPAMVTLFAGQHTGVGTVEIEVVGDELHITYVMWGDCLKLVETHLAVGDSLQDIPQTKKGNPIPGQFEYSGDHDYVSSYEYVIPYDCSVVYYIAAHAVVAKDPCCQCDVGIVMETVWAGCHDFPGANWATYFTYP